MAENTNGAGRYAFGNGVEAEGIIASVIANMTEADMDSHAVWDVANALKYLLRIGRKDDPMTELGKAENYLHHARTGEWMVRE
jgi:hypothetical protein